MENMDQGLTVPAKMGADSSAENTPNAPEFIYIPNLFAQAQKLQISMKKMASLGVRSLWLC